MPEGFHPPLEEYLEAVLALEEDGVPVIQARLAERLGHSAQSVSEMVQRLAAEGYLHRSGRGLSLTEQGRRRAESVVRRHRLAERFLVDVLGLDWHRAHAEAGRWEHVISEEVERRLDEVLGHPTTCPHGNPIPGAGADLGSQRPMSQSSPGETIRLARIAEEVETDADALGLLYGLGLRPGREATVRARGNDGSLTLVLDAEPGAAGHGQVVELSARLCRRLYVLET